MEKPMKFHMHDTLACYTLLITQNASSIVHFISFHLEFIVDDVWNIHFSNQVKKEHILRQNTWVK